MHVDNNNNAILQSNEKYLMMRIILAWKGEIIRAWCADELLKLVLQIAMSLKAVEKWLLSNLQQAFNIRRFSCKMLSNKKRRCKRIIKLSMNIVSCHIETN